MTLKGIVAGLSALDEIERLRTRLAQAERERDELKDQTICGYCDFDRSIEKERDSLRTQLLASQANEAHLLISLGRLAAEYEGACHCTGKLHRCECVWFDVMENIVGKDPTL